jgi:predicted site-specific integrase-resolvase
MQGMTTEELSRYIRISKRTLIHWRKTGKGPRFVRYGGFVRYPHDAVSAFLRDGESSKDNAEMASSSDHTT